MAAATSRAAKAPAEAAPTVVSPAPEPRRVWTPPPRRSGGDSGPRASSVIADLWSEREEQHAPPPPPVLAVAPPLRPPPKPPRGTSGAGRGRTKIVAAIVAAVVLVGAGVGVMLARAGGTSSKQAYIAKADSVCRPANDPVRSAPKPTSFIELATAMGTLATATDAQLAQLHQLKLPPGVAGGQASTMWSTLATANQSARRLEDAARRADDPATASATTQVAAQFGDAGVQAKAYGFAACAVGLQVGVDNMVGGAKALIKTSFMAKADSLCRAGARSLAAFPDPKDDARDLARYLSQTLPLVSKMLLDLKALTVMPGDEAVVADMWAAEGKVVAKAVEMKESAAGNDRSRFIAADQESAVLTTAADAKIDAYGLGVCGSNFGKS